MRIELEGPAERRFRNVRRKLWRAGLRAPTSEDAMLFLLDVAESGAVDELVPVWAAQRDAGHPGGGSWSAP